MEGILVQQLQHGWLALQQADAQVGEPLADAGTLRSQRFEPHLPVQPRLVRLAKTGSAFHVAGFVSELVGKPRQTIVAAFDDDLVAGSRHHAEQAVGIGAIHWRERGVGEHECLGHELWWSCVRTKTEVHLHCGHE